MAIGNAVEKGPLVYVYDEKGRQIFAKSRGNRPDDGLKGYTSATVNIKIGNLILTYDEKGRQISATSAR
jgi:hypothetical protein